MLGAARPVKGEPFLSWRPHFGCSVFFGLFGVGGAGRARARAAHLYPPRCLSRRGPSFALVAGSRASMAWSRDATGCRAPGISRVGSQAAWVVARPNSLLAGFPQLHVRSLAARREDEPETQRFAGVAVLQPPRVRKPQARKLGRGRGMLEPVNASSISVNESSGHPGGRRGLDTSDPRVPNTRGCYQQDGSKAWTTNATPAVAYRSMQRSSAHAFHS